MASKILIKNIKGLVNVDNQYNQTKISGAEMATLNTIENAYLAIENGQIVAFGSMQDWGGIADWRNLEIIDARGKYVLPTWCDSHTHLIYAKSREEEFVYRIEGLSYEEIGKRGGGILNSAKRLQQATEEELYQSALLRVKEIMATGTGAVEIKSGYGLTVDAELKMLRVIKRLKETTPLTIKSTFLGAHAFPQEFKENKQGYIDQIINEMLPIVAEEKLADYIDVFCERGYFTNEQTDMILKAGKALGLTAKVHVNQFTISGGIKVCIENKALSVDHLEVLSDEEIELLKNSETMATVLPSCSFFLNIPYAPARKLIDADVPLAMATDFNPGTTPSGNIPFLLSLACTQMKMLPQEAIHSVTTNAAYAMGVNQTHGTIALGKSASVIITKEIPSIAYLPYSFGTNNIDQVIINGELIK